MLSVVLGVHVTCASWSPSSWTNAPCSQDKNSLRPFSPSESELSITGSEHTDGARMAACPPCRGDGVSWGQAHGPAAPAFCLFTEIFRGQMRSYIEDLLLYPYFQQSIYEELRLWET